MRKFFFLPLALAISATALTWATAPKLPADAPKVAAPSSEIAIGADAPLFTLPDSSGKSVNLADYKGKVIVLEWINKDCPIDQRVITSKLISTVYDKFKDKVAWLAIDSTAAHTKADYDKTIADFKLTYPLLNDAKGAVGHLYKAETTPHLFIINTDGKLVYKGGIDDDPLGAKTTKINYVNNALTELLSGKKITIAESKPYGCSVKYAD